MLNFEMIPDDEDEDFGEKVGPLEEDQVHLDLGTEVDRQPQLPAFGRRHTCTNFHSPHLTCVRIFRAAMLLCSRIF